MSPDLVQQIAFIRYLYSVAREQSTRPSPMKWACVLTLHDTLELFIDVVATHLSVQHRAKQTLLEKWKDVDDALGSKHLAQRQSVDRLITVRRAFKHNFVPPSDEAISQALSTVQIFLEENVKQIFGKELSDITLISLIAEEKVRGHLDTARAHMASSHWNYAANEIGKAWALLVDRRWFDLQERIRISDPFDAFTNRELSPLIRVVRELTVRLDAIGTGIDYTKMTKFLKYIPTFTLTEAGNIYIQLHPDGFDEDKCSFCFDFVLQSALRIQQLR